MAKSAKRLPGDKLGKWILNELIGGGGNGYVWHVSPAAGTGEDRALKVLKRTSETIFTRFTAEIEALKRAKGIVGIVPLLDEDLNYNSEAGPRWYVMPLAEPITNGLTGASAIEIVEAFVPLARTLADLHMLGIHHRDIKLSNILFYEGRLCFSDFGLVKYPGRADVTPSKHELGPKFTMAPEMRRDAQTAAGAPADVYSFAKTLWSALTGLRLAFDGQYSAASSLGIKHFHGDIFSTPLDQLLSECTDNDPAFRPTIGDVEHRLADWVRMMHDFHSRNIREWLSIQSRLFPVGAPQRAIWTGIDEICAVLRVAAESRNLNHLFLPTGGGQDLTKIELAAEPGFISLVGPSVILTPRSLSYESFGPGSPWNYFRLEAEPVPPTGVPGAYIGPDGLMEVLCELTAGKYVRIDVWEEGEYNDAPLPKAARPIQRALKGAFVMFAKRSWYNLISETYDARHQRMSGDEFRDYISQVAVKYPDPPPSTM
jgi:serine/threonine protein kinase